MSASRWIVVAAIGAALAGLVTWWPGTEGTEDLDVVRPPVPVAVDGAGSAWFCAARDAGVDPLVHTVSLTSLGDARTTVELTAFGEAGEGGGTRVELGAGATTIVDVATLGGAAQSVMVEAVGAVVVEHLLAGPEGADQAPCATLSSDTWYFPAVSTTRDATARLTLFNPFEGDAALDIEVAYDSGVRVPAELSGIVVPSGTSKVVELGTAAQRRDQFSATVRTRSGRVVAELAQSFDDADASLPVSGLRIEAGARAPAPRWVVAGGFTDATAREVLVVQNPTPDVVEVLVQVVPYGGLETLPEPFSVQVPALRYGLIDLQAESRVPQVGYHAVMVESTGGEDVVVARTLDVSATAEAPDTPMRADIERGTTASVGAVAAAGRWLSGSLPADPALSAVLVHNPGGGIAVLEVTALGAAADAAGAASAPAVLRLEIPAGDSQIVTAAQVLGEGVLPDGPFTLEVSAETAVVVERLSIYPDEADFSMQPAVPVVGRAADLEGL